MQSVPARRGERTCQGGIFGDHTSAGGGLVVRRG